MKVGDKVMLNEKYKSCGHNTAGSIGIIRKIGNSNVRVHFISGYCKIHNCQRDDSTCVFKLNQVDLVLEHNRNGANS